MSNKKGLVLLISAMMLLSLLPLAFAVNIDDAVSGAGVTKVTSGTLTETISQDDAAQGGNVTELNLTSAASTTKWAGYYGQVTASLALGFGTKALFSFGNVQNDQIKSVFATQDNAFDFSAIVAGSATTVDTAWSFTGADSDSAASSHTSVALVSGITVTAALPLNSHVGGVQTSGVYNSSILNDGSSAVKGDFAFGVAVDVDETGFDNTTQVDYELVVPISDGATPESYYFFMDIQ